MKKFFNYEYVIIENNSGDGFKYFNVSCNVWDCPHIVLVTEDNANKLMVFDMSNLKTFKFNYKYDDLKTEEDFNELIEMAENLFNSGAHI